VVAGCFGTLSFEWMPTIATIATTAKEQPTTAISRARFSSRPIFPPLPSVCEDKQSWTVTRSVTISAIPFRWSDRRPVVIVAADQGVSVRANPDRVLSPLPMGRGATISARRPAGRRTARTP
jgi:hypothetical protein